MTSATRIVLVEDHLIVREAMVSLLGVRTDLQVAGVAASIRETKLLLERTKPDMLILDLSLEDGNGIELARELSRCHSRTRVLVLTGFADGFAVKEAMAAGVAGYVLKEQPVADLFAAIESVRQGRRYVAPAIAARIGPDRTSDKKDDPFATLSRRESEVFRFIVSGCSSKELARRLFI